MSMDGMTSVKSELIDKANCLGLFTKKLILSVCLSLCLFVCLCAYLVVCLSVCLFGLVFVYVDASVQLFFIFIYLCVSLCLTGYVYVFCLFVCLMLLCYLFVCLFYPSRTWTNLFITYVIWMKCQTVGKAGLGFNKLYKLITPTQFGSLVNYDNSYT